MGVKVRKLGRAKKVIIATGNDILDATHSAQIKAAQKIVDRARELAPYKTGDLEHSIDYYQEMTNKFGRQVVIRMNKKVGRVAKYGDEMHNNYEKYKPGKGTIAKRESGIPAGGQFITRAAYEERSTFYELAKMYIKIGMSGLKTKLKSLKTIRRQR